MMRVRVIGERLVRVPGNTIIEVDAVLARDMEKAGIGEIVGSAELETAQLPETQNKMMKRKRGKQSIGDFAHGT